MIVIGACGFIGVLSAIVIVAINPAKDFEQARDVQRNADVNMIGTAIRQYYVEEPETAADLISSIIPCQEGSESIELYGTWDNALVSDYLVALPVDPSAENINQETGYAICRTETSLIISAPYTEGDEIIKVIAPIK